MRSSTGLRENGPPLGAKTRSRFPYEMLIPTWPQNAQTVSWPFAIGRLQKEAEGPVPLHCADEAHTPKSGYTVSGVILKYTVVLQRTEEGVSVGCPGLPGCWSQGATEQEALENIQAAIQEYLAAVRDSLKGGEIREAEVTV